MDLEIRLQRGVPELELPRFPRLYRLPIDVFELAADGLGERLPEDIAEDRVRVTFEYLRGTPVHVREPPLLVEGVERVGHPPEVCFEPSFGTRPRDDVADPVGEHRELVGSRLFPEVVVHARRDGFARDFLGPATGEQEEGDVAVSLANGLQELDPVRPRHVVVADDTVDPGRVQQLNGVGDRRHRGHVEPAVGPFEKRAREFGEIGFVVDMQDADRRGGVQRRVLTGPPVGPVDHLDGEDRPTC